MNKGKWSVGSYDCAAARRMTQFGYTPLVAATLCSRGVTTPEAASELLADGDDRLHDPMLMADMEKAASRVRLAVERKEKVAVYGDYDVDGVTSACVVYEYLTRSGLDCSVYIPDRIDEGYGVNEKAVRAIAESGVTLMLTVDCGVTAIAEAEMAKSLGMDVVITDHHECGERLPEAVAVVDPRRPDCPYPYKGLAGVGVAFKLIAAITGDQRELMAACGDLVAVGTLADVMPVTGENRALIRRGMETLHRGSRNGLRAIVEAAGLDIGRITPDKIGYAIAPRLNAAGRMGCSKRAFSLLAAETPAEAESIAAELSLLNQERRRLENEMLQEAVAETQSHRAGTPVILASDTWHQGVAGIVASRLAEKYRAPAIIICFDGEEGRGSCRSYGGFDLFSALDACRDLLEDFGGHMLAAGMTLKRENLNEFMRRFAEKFRADTTGQPEPLFTVDFELRRPEVLSIANVTDLMRMEPWGAGNPQPVICLTGVSIEQIIPMSEGKHLRLRVSKDSYMLDCVLFSRTLFSLGLRPGDRADIAFFPQINEFRGTRNVQLLLREVRAAAETAEENRRDSALIARLDGQLTKEEKRELMPDRTVFAEVWHTAERLAEPGSRFGGEREDVLFGLSALLPRIAMPKIYAALRVFSEMGLVSMSEESGAIEVEVHPNNRRADLNASRLLRKLRG